MKIAVFLETYKGKIVKASLEALAAANKIGGEVTGILLGSNDELIATAGNFGVANLATGSGDLFNEYHSGIFSRAISNVEADMYVIAATVWGKELAARVSAKHDIAFVGDVSEVKAANQFVRSIHGNKVLATVEVTGKAVLTIRPGVFDVPAETGGSATTSEISVAAADNDAAFKLAEILASSTDKIELTEADIIVSGGRGVGDPDKWHLITDLANELGAAYGASRAVVDAGWRPHAEQVGQTGKFVSPKLYIAIGISGAIQHLAGMSTSDIIVAINKDSEAPIFKVADYGIVGDLFDVVPKLLDAIKAAKA